MRAARICFLLLFCGVAGQLRAAIPSAQPTFSVADARLPDPLVLIAYGGGGAAPYEVERTGSDRYRGPDFPNYHYVRFELHGDRVAGEMIRLAYYADAAPKQWETLDRFEITLRP